MAIRVSIDQDTCISCGLCSEIEPHHFFNTEGGLAFVKIGGKDPAEPQFRGIDQYAEVDAGHEDAVIEAVEECPVECIWLDTTEKASAA